MKRLSVLLVEKHVPVVVIYEVHARKFSLIHDMKFYLVHDMKFYLVHDMKFYFGT